MGMRLWSILLFYVALNLSLTVFSDDSIGLTAGGVSGTLNSTSLSNTNLNLSSAAQIREVPQEAQLFPYAGWVSAFTRLMDDIYDMVFGLASLLAQMGMPSVLVHGVEVMTLLLYALTAIQIMRGMQVEK